MSTGILISIALFLALGIYFLPTLIAGSRYHHQKLAIFMLNLFLGWTALGWIIALVWACTKVQPPVAVAYYARVEPRIYP